MILVDTSVWIEFLRGNSQFSSLAEKILHRQIVTVEVIFGELLQGVRSQEEASVVYNYWFNLPRIDEPGLWIQAGLNSSREKLISKGIGLIDAYLMVAARKHQALIWTLDKKLLAILSDEEIYR